MMRHDARVWAPHAQHVVLHRERGGELTHVAMEPAGEWWVAPTALEHGDSDGGSA